MPIFEYICKDCKKRFEALVYGDKQAQCPLCRGVNLDQQISVFSVGANNRSKSASAGCGAASSCGMAGSPGCCME